MQEQEPGAETQPNGHSGSGCGRPATERKVL
jgi:hypothetical protein